MGTPTKTSLDHRKDFLCVLSETEILDRKNNRNLVKEWYPVDPTDALEVQTLVGRPVTITDAEEGIYRDEEGNVFQLLDKGQTKPIEIEHLPEGGKTKPEELLNTSLNGKRTHEQNGDSKKVQRKNRNNGRKRQAPPTNGAALQVLRPKTTTAQPNANAANGAGAEAPVQLNLRQKLAEVRRRVGYIQKRGHNERFNYSYVTAADIAGSVGDILAELGVVVIPSLEEISYESAAGRGGATPMARVIMAYTFADVDSDEEVVATAAGQGLDAGDKAPYKAMTGALKYALLQTFLLATGDDPEDERVDAHFNKPSSGRSINAEQIRDLEKRIEDTGTDLQRVLAYYKVASLSEMTEFAYRVAVKVLNRKLATR